MDGAAAKERGALDRMSRPRSVAVVGTSATPSKIGGIPVDYLQSFSFQDRVIPVNPKAAEIQGLPACPSLAAVSRLAAANAESLERSRPAIGAG